MPGLDDMGDSASIFDAIVDNPSAPKKADDTKVSNRRTSGDDNDDGGTAQTGAVEEDVTASILTDQTDENDADSEADEPTPRSTTVKEADDASENGDDEEDKSSDPLDRLFSSSDEEEESDNDEESDDQPTFATDDSLVKVKVDGEEREFSVAELKRFASGEGAIEQRLQQVTEARSSLHRQIEENRQTMQNIVTAIKGYLFTPSMQPPSEDLLATGNAADARMYLAQKEAYQAEQNAIRQRVNEVGGVLQQMNEASQSFIEDYRNEQAQLLVRKMPFLQDEGKAKKFETAIKHMAINDYGFTEQEFNAASDHRVYLLAADAYRWRAAQGQIKTVDKTKGRNSKPKTKTTKPTAQASAVGNRSVTNVHKRNLQKARQTGRPEDVALSSALLQPANRKGRKNGR